MVSIDDATQGLKLNAYSKLSPAHGISKCTSWQHASQLSCQHSGLLCVARQAICQECSVHSSDCLPQIVRVISYETGVICIHQNPQSHCEWQFCIALAAINLARDLDPQGAQYWQKCWHSWVQAQVGELSCQRNPYLKPASVPRAGDSIAPLMTALCPTWQVHDEGRQAQAGAPLCSRIWQGKPLSTE